MATRKTSRTRKSGKKKTKKHSSTPASRLITSLRERIGERFSDPEVMRDALSRVITAAVAIALLTAWMIGRAPLREHVGQIRAEALTASSLQWPGDSAGRVPHWIPALVLEDLERITLARLSPDPLDHDSLVSVREGLLGTGWLADVNEVRRRADGTILIDGQWRQPFAVIRHDGLKYVVGRGGELMQLPGGASIEPGSNMFVVDNPHLDPPRNADRTEIRYGVPWRGDDIAAALNLIDRIDDIDGAEQITGVDLSIYGDPGSRSEHIVLVTNSGSRIDWGRGLGEAPPPGEVDVATKIMRLEQNYRDYGRIDLDMTRRHFDLYTFGGMEIDRTASRE